MKLFITNTLEKLQNWTLKWTNTSYAVETLFFVALIEAVFFPIPPEILMIALIAARPEKWKRYSTVAVIGSVLGGTLGYAIGNGLYGIIGQQLVQFYNVEGAISIIKTQFSNNALVAILVAAITPIVPYKAMVFAAGLFDIPILQIITGSFIGRGIRYFGIGWLIKKYGERMSQIIYERVNEISIVIVIIVIITFIVIKIGF